MRHRRSRAVTTTAFVAIAALVLSACGADDEADEPDTTDDVEVTEDDEVEDEPEEEVEEDAAPTGAVVYAAEQEFASYNNNTAEQNAFRNTLVLNGVLSGFWRFGPDGFADPDTVFGTYELISEDPQTVRYTINDDAVWSDGTPIDCADMMLAWAAASGYYETGETDEDGNPVLLFSTAGTAGYEDWAKPSCEPGDKTLDAVYENVYASWEAINPMNVPAHIVAEQGGLTVEEMLQAFADDDIDALAAAADFYNNGWVMNPGDLLDESLIPSSGPYKLSEWVAGESLTLTVNENYWGPAPATDTIIFRFLDQDQQIQALENREVDIIDPQPNPDLVNQLQGLSGIEVVTAESFVYEHFDFNMREGGAFVDRQLREAFALCLPRERIVENLIRPQNPDAQVLNARLTYSFQPDYDFQIEGSNYVNYTEQDIEGARAILEELDMVGMEVRIGYQSPNPRRTNQVELARDACNEAGFEVIDHGQEDFFGNGLAAGDWDIALFAWVGSSYVSGTASTFTTGGGNNNGGYSNPEVDALFEELLAELDPDRAREVVRDIEAILWEDIPTIPVFTFPELAAWDESIQGVVPNFTQGGITWNMDEWARM